MKADKDTRIRPMTEIDLRTLGIHADNTEKFTDRDEMKLRDLGIFLRKGDEINGFLQVQISDAAKLPANRRNQS